MNPLCLFFIGLALLGYTIAIFFRINHYCFSWSKYLTFALALICDYVGTGMMMEKSVWAALSPHELCGLFALGIMTFHFLWLSAVRRRIGSRSLLLFHIWAKVAWGAWLLALVTGEPHVNQFLITLLS